MKPLRMCRRSSFLSLYLHCLLLHLAVHLQLQTEPEIVSNTKAPFSSHAFYVKSELYTVKVKPTV